MEHLLRSIKGLLVDLDGVVYRGSTPTPGASAFFRQLDAIGLPYLLLTNNSTRTPVQCAEKLCSMGVSVHPDRVLTSGVATSALLRQMAPMGGKVMVVGEEGLRGALGEGPFVLVEDGTADFVVVGLDRRFDYDKLSRATRAIRAGAQLIATNPDLTLPTEQGELPGAGALLAAIVAASGAQPTIVGKPEPTMFLMGAERLGLRPDETAMVGDRLDTDIAGARRAGLMAILVLTGVSTLEDLDRAQERPDRVFRDLQELGAALVAAKS